MNDEILGNNIKINNDFIKQIKTIFKDNEIIMKTDDLGFNEIYIKNKNGTLTSFTVDGNDIDDKNIPSFGISLYEDFGENEPDESHIIKVDLLYTFEDSVEEIKKLIEENK